MMQATNYQSDPKKFWSVAASLGAYVLGEGQERTSNSLVWAAALTMALEKLLEEGGPEFERDLELAKKGRRQLAARDITFSIERAEGGEHEAG